MGLGLGLGLGLGVGVGLGVGLGLGFLQERLARDLRLAILLGNVERRLAAWIDGDVRSGHGP